MMDIDGTIEIPLVCQLPYLLHGVSIHVVLLEQRISVQQVVQKKKTTDRCATTVVSKDDAHCRCIYVGP